MKPTIVLVDDDKLISVIFKKMLEKLNYHYHVIDFTSPLEFIDYVQKLSNREVEAPFLLMIDINMPELSGWEVLDILEDKYDFLADKCKICVLSSSENSTDIAKAKEHPMVDEYIVKPVDKETIDFLLKIEA